MKHLDYQSTLHAVQTTMGRSIFEKLIPLMIINALNNKQLPVYGDGLNVRDWLHVEDHCQAIDLVLHKGKMVRYIMLVEIMSVLILKL